MIYRCNDCGHICEEDELEMETTSYEALYGVESEFGGRTLISIYKCPSCGSYDIAKSVKMDDLEIADE